MSTRSKKTSVRQETVASTSSQQSTPSASFTSPGRNRPPSPSMISRVAEKVELAGLNDRLAAYIDRVRTLEIENRHLTKLVQTQEETVHRETTNIKSLYESELADARKLLDETAKEKAKLQLDVNKYKKEYEDLKEKYTVQSKDLSAVQKRVLAAESQVNDLQARLNDAVSQRKHWEDEYNKLKKDYDNLVKQLASSKKQLEDEMVSRVDLENKLQSLKEDFQFKSQIHDQELNETLSRTRVEIEEVDGRLQQEYDGKLAEALRDMRESNDDMIRITRVETEDVFEKKLADLRRLAAKNDDAVSRSQQEMSSYRKKVNEMSSELAKLRSQSAAQEARIKDLEEHLAQEQKDHTNSVETRDAEIKRLRVTLEEQMTEYRDLLDIKIKLDTEIAAYRKLLEGEETRLNISTASEATPSRPTPGRRTPSRATPVSRKRKRIAIDSGESSLAGLSQLTQSKSNTGFSSTSTAKGSLEINEIDSDGKFIKLYNSSDSKDISIGNWIIKLVGGDSQTVFKFHRNSTLKAGQYVTVWSADSDQSHQPPGNMVMKGQKWFTADNMTATLTNGTEEMASREMKRSALRTTFTRSGTRTVDEPDFGEGDPEHKDKCVIM